jgi:hypothetical protein
MFSFIKIKRFIVENKIQEEDVYKFIERVGPGITRKMELKDNPGLSSIHADKARQYRKVWESEGIPFLYAAFIYVMSYTVPYIARVEAFGGRSSIAEWVIHYWENNAHFRRYIKEEDTGRKQYTIYWMHNERTVIYCLNGDDFATAFTRAGYGKGAARAVDVYLPGDDHEYIWSTKDNRWVRVTYLRLSILVPQPGGTIITDDTPDYSNEAISKLNEAGLDWMHEYYLPTDGVYHATVRIFGYPFHIIEKLKETFDGVHYLDQFYYPELTEQLTFHLLNLTFLKS